MNRKQYLIVFSGMVAISLIVSIVVVLLFPFGTFWAERFAVPDEKKLARIRLEMLQEDPAISLSDEKGKARFFIIQNKKKGMSINFADRNHKPQACLFVHEKGTKALIFWDANEKKRAVLSVTREGIPSLTFEDEKGNTRVSLGLLENGQPKMIFYNEDQQVQWETP